MSRAITDLKFKEKFPVKGTDQNVFFGAVKKGFPQGAPLIDQHGCCVGGFYHPLTKGGLRGAVNEASRYKDITKGDHVGIVFRYRNTYSDSPGKARGAETLLSLLEKSLHPSLRKYYTVDREDQVISMRFTDNLDGFTYGAIYQTLRQGADKSIPPHLDEAADFVGSCPRRARFYLAATMWHESGHSIRLAMPILAAGLIWSEFGDILAREDSPVFKGGARSCYSRPRGQPSGWGGRDNDLLSIRIQDNAGKYGVPDTLRPTGVRNSGVWRKNMECAWERHEKLREVLLPALREGKEILFDPTGTNKERRCRDRLLVGLRGDKD